jgi:hypothetical protein
MKKNILLVFGLGDAFCSEKSHRLIKRGPAIANKVKQIIGSDTDKVYGYVQINEPSDTFNDIDVFSDLEKKQRVIGLKLCANNIMDTNNQIIVKSANLTEETILDGNQLDHVLPSSKYEISIAGIDINGIFIDTVKRLKSMGYSVTVYSDAIKPFNKATVDVIRNSKVRFRKF